MHRTEMLLARLRQPSKSKVPEVPGRTEDAAGLRQKAEDSSRCETCAVRNGRIVTGGANHEMRSQARRELRTHAQRLQGPDTAVHAAASAPDELVDWSGTARTFRLFFSTTLEIEFFRTKTDEFKPGQRRVT